MYLGKYRKVKETVFPQFSLPLRNATGIDDLSDAKVASFPTMLKAINVCMDVSGLQDDQIADVIGTSTGNLSKYRSGQYNYPPDRLIPLMEACGNMIPLRWLALRSGQKIAPLLSTVEQQRDAERARAEAAEARLETITKFLQQVGLRVT